LPQPTTTRPRVRVAALALLAQRRLTEAQLWKKLLARGYDDDDVAAAVAACKADGYVDDRLYASLYVEGARKAVGDARLCADLVKRGIDREAAAHVVADAPLDERARIDAAYAKIRRVQPQLAYPSVARKLERLGFPSSLIYRVLRERAGADQAWGLPDGADGA
jgi:regulatory protein